MGFIKKAFDFVARPSHSRTMGLAVMLLLVTAVFLTVYVAQQQQQIRQQASSQRASEGYVCSIINNITECAFSASSSDVPCNTATDKCKIGNTIYECKRQ